MTKVRLGILINELEDLHFSYDITPMHIYEKMVELKKEIKKLEDEGWRYEFKRETYTAFTICIKKYQKSKCKFRGCINEYFETKEQAAQWITNAPLNDGIYNYSYEIYKSIRYRDIHYNYNIITGEDYITEQCY